MDINIKELINNPLRNLSHTNRWSGFRCIETETVSDHVWGMIALALLLVPDYNKYAEDNQRIDIKDIIFRCSVHDLDECLSCDIPRPFKYHNKDLKKAIDNTTSLLMKQKFSEELYDNVTNSKDDTPAGHFVSLLDSWQAVDYMYKEVFMGNKYFENELNNGIKILLYKTKQYYDPATESKLNIRINELVDDYVKQIKINIE